MVGEPDGDPGPGHFLVHPAQVQGRRQGRRSFWDDGPALSYLPLRIRQVGIVHVEGETLQKQSVRPAAYPEGQDDIRAESVDFRHEMMFTLGVGGFQDRRSNLHFRPPFFRRSPENAHQFFGRVQVGARERSKPGEEYSRVHGFECRSGGRFGQG